MNAPIDITDIRIETERLVLRAWREDDLQDLFEYSRILEIGEMAGWPALQTIGEAREVLELFQREPNVFALELKENGKVIGSLGIDWLESDPELWNANMLIFSYDLHKDFWGRGLMPEAVRAVIPYCFETFHADYLRIGAFSGNFRSQRVAEKCGFRFWKEMEYPLRNGTSETERVYILQNPTRDRYTSVLTGSQ